MVTFIHVLAFLPIFSVCLAKQWVTPIEKLVDDWGYPLETHSVITADKYVLTVHRVRHGRGKSVTNPVPVFLQHGLKGSSATFLSIRTGIAYQLADAGYDVWVGNARGNKYSRGHVKKNHRRDKTYWNFSFHEMGVFDLPAVLKYIKDTTRVDKVHYIGFSMGTTQFLIMGSVVPQHLNMVDCIILMGPVAIPAHMDKLNTKFGLQKNKALINIARMFRKWEMYKNHQIMSATLHRLCTSRGWTGRICEKMLRGKSPGGVDLYDFKNGNDAWRYYRAGTSIKVYRHYIQMAEAGKFRQFDYKSKNPNYYTKRLDGKCEPPEYNLKNIKNTVYLLVGGNDKIAHQEDVKWLTSQLLHPVVVEFKHFTHRDFLFGIQLDKLFRTINDIIVWHMAAKSNTSLRYPSCVIE